MFEEKGENKEEVKSIQKKAMGVSGLGNGALTGKVKELGKY